MLKETVQLKATAFAKLVEKKLGENLLLIGFSEHLSNLHEHRKYRNGGPPSGHLK